MSWLEELFEEGLGPIIVASALAFMVLALIFMWEFI